MLPLPSEIAEYGRAALAMLAPEDRGAAWWDIGIRLMRIVARVVAPGGGAARVVAPPESFLGLPIRWIDGDRIRLMRPAGPLDAVPLAIAWACPRRGPMIADGCNDRRPGRLAVGWTVDRASAALATAFGDGLRRALGPG